MNNNLKKIIAVTLTVNAFALIEPAKEINIFTKTAYAVKYDDPLLSELKISGYDIDFDKETYKYNLKVDKNVDEITVTARPEDSAYEVTVDGDEAKEDDKYKVKVDVKQGKSTITIRVKDENHDLKTLYELEVTRGSSDDGEDLDKDDVYLDNITLSAGTIDFSSKVTEYSVYIENAVRYLDVKAKPIDEDEDYVEINGEEAEENDHYEQTVTLKDGKNKITIRVENSNCVKKYILTVYNGVKPPVKADKDEADEKDINNNNNTNSGINDADNSVQYKNKWITVDGIWVYYDGNGNLLKNQWYNDLTTGKAYFFNENGVMATGWLNKDNKWYYLNEDGSKNTGWKFIMGVWYHFDDQGVMNTGWIQDTDGKWYYMNDTGAMLCNTTVGGYKLGSDGSWIK